MLIAVAATLLATPSQAQTDLPDASITELQPGIWVHKTYAEIPGYGPFPSNGLIILDGGEALIIDTSWTDEQTAELFDWIEDVASPQSIRVVATHAHDDRLGGLVEANSQGAETIAHELTAAAAIERGYPGRFDTTFSAPSKTIRVGAIAVELFYPGPAHSRDNIVVYVHGRGLLAGGCMIRSAFARSLGSTTDADIGAWADSARAVKERFPNLEIVTPGHGAIGGAELIERTIELAETATE